MRRQRQWSCWYEVGDGELRCFSAASQPQKECPASSHHGQEMRIGARDVDGVFVVKEIRRSTGKVWRLAWSDGDMPE